MKKSELERLMADLRGDATLRTEFQRLENPEQAAKKAAALGYRLTPHEVAELVSSFHGLSDEDLDKAAGGAWNDPPPGTTSSSSGS